MLFRALTTLIVPILCFYILIIQAVFADSVARMQSAQETTVVNQERSVSLILLSVAVLENITVAGHTVTDLSALAWDEDENILFAVSDNGFLLQLRPVYESEKLVDTILLNGYQLRDENGEVLQGRFVDAEGLAIKNERNNIPGDTQLYISFERAPRIIEYSMEGRFIRAMTLPVELADIDNYRGKNSALESLLFHEKLGLLTGPEFPLKNESLGQLVVYALNGYHWRVLANDPKYGALVELATLPNGNILLLERAYHALFPELVTSFHCLDPDTGQSSKLISLRPDAPLFNENFEGITRIKDDIYMMVSDDNNYILKQTLLVYFRLLIKSADNTCSTDVIDPATSPIDAASTQPDYKAGYDNPAAD